MKDQYEKLEYLRLQGRGLEPREAKEIARRLGIGKSAWSVCSSRSHRNALPKKHDVKLGKIFGFDPSWPEWREGNVEDFRTRYEASSPSALTIADAATLAAQVDAGFRPRIGLAGHNRQGVLKEALTRALGVIRGEEAFCAGLDPEALAREIVMLQRIFSDLEVDRAAVVKLVMPAEVREVLAALEARCGGCIASDDIDRAFLAMLERGYKEAKRLLDAGEIEANLRTALERLCLLLENALSGGTIDLGWMSSEVDYAEQCERRTFDRGARALRCAVGLRVDVAPPFAIFVDGPEPWMPEMVVLPTGRFTMGSPEDEEERASAEGPQRDVKVGRFALGRYAVTFAEYDAFCEAAEHEKPQDEGWGRDRHPVIHISWNDATAYARWLSDQIDQTYRLPSEAEWEYACRAGSDTPFEPTVARRYGGQSITPDEANFDGNYTYGASAKGEYRQRNVQVDHAQFPSNRWGLWQMHGNVYEWCADVWVGTYDDARLDALPREQLDGDGGTLQRVLRGGSWVFFPRDLRSALRSRYGPGNRNWVIGFRLARTLTL